MDFTIFYGIGDKLCKTLENLVIIEKIATKQQLKKASKNQLKNMLMNEKIFNTLPVITKEDLIKNTDKIIPRQIIDIVNNEFSKYLKKFKYKIAGSYLRKLPRSSDIDLVISKGRYKNSSSLFNAVATCLKNSKNIFLHEPVMTGGNKYVVFIDVKNNLYPSFKKKFTVKMDFFITIPDEYVFTLLYATGSPENNITMRYVAKTKGYTLNQKGLFKNNKKIKNLNTEKQIFEFLNLEYKKPENR